jgi:2-iminobutanoate/2-iminopropanoate deaminase
MTGGRLVPVATDGAPRAIGPYSQAVAGAGRLLFTAGQIGLVPATGAMAEGGIAGETRQALANLEAILAAEGLSLAHVARTTVYLADMADFAAMNEIYAAAFGAHRPARSTVAALALPKGARVEIDAIAIYP